MFIIHHTYMIIQREKCMNSLNFIESNRFNFNLINILSCSYGLIMWNWFIQATNCFISTRLQLKSCESENVNIEAVSESRKRHAGKIQHKDIGELIILG